ncbi:MAG: hypothetical protein U1E35_08525 [Rhodospirillales bacterium]
MEVVLPLRDGPFFLAELRARTTTTGELQVESGRLVSTLATILKPEDVTAVKAAIGERAYVPLGALAATGVTIDYDPVSNDLRLQVDPGKRAPRSISAVGTPAGSEPGVRGAKRGQRLRQPAQQPRLR